MSANHSSSLLQSYWRGPAVVRSYHDTPASHKRTPPNGTVGQGCWLMMPPFMDIPNNVDGTAPGGGATTVMKAVALLALPAELATCTQKFVEELRGGEL